MLVIKSSGKTILLDYNPKKYTTKGGAARGLYKALKKACKEYGQDPDIEIAIWSPEENSENCWRVSWESGPYQWAIGASFKITGPWGFTEPYYSFDLCFVE